MLIAKQDALGFGLYEMSITLLITGAVIIIASTIGFCSVSGRRTFAMRIFSGILLLGAIYQVGFGIFTIIRRGKVTKRKYKFIYIYIGIDGGFY